MESRPGIRLCLCNYSDENEGRRSESHYTDKAMKADPGGRRLAPGVAGRVARIQIRHYIRRVINL